MTDENKPEIDGLIMPQTDYLKIDRVILESVRPDSQAMKPFTVALAIPGIGEVLICAPKPEIAQRIASNLIGQPIDINLVDVVYIQNKSFCVEKKNIIVS